MCGDGRKAALLMYLIPLCLAVAFAGATPGAVAASNDASANSFSGSCDFSGTVTFDPPLTTSSQPTQATAEASGPCSGTWTRPNGGEQTLNDAPVRYHAESDGTQSCGSASAAGTGLLEYARRKIRFAFSEERAGAVAPIRLEGQNGGSFMGTATASGDPLTIIERCAGSGLESVGIDINGSTTPTISG
jgi:hypothetical protein